VLVLFACLLIRWRTALVICVLVVFGVVIIVAWVLILFWLFIWVGAAWCGMDCSFFLCYIV